MDWLLLDGPFLAAALPREFAFYVRVKALKDRETLGIIVIEPAGKVEPVPVGWDAWAGIGRQSFQRYLNSLCRVRISLPLLRVLRLH
jgi:hypothetical protein